MLLKRALIFFIISMSFYHVITLGQVPRLGAQEGWYADSSYAYHKLGVFDDTMFPGLVEFANGSFGQGKLRYLLQAQAFDLLGFGLYQARLPMLLGGILSVFFVYLIGRFLFGTEAGLCAAALYVLSPIFYETHGAGSHAWLAAGFALAAYWGTRMVVDDRPILAFAAGLTIGLSVSFHFTAVLGVAALTAVLFFFRFKNDVNNRQIAFYFLGGLVAFGVWYQFEVFPVGVDAYVKKVMYRMDMVQAGYIGKHWIIYFIEGRRGTIIELPLFLIALGAIRFFWADLRSRFLYLFFIGLILTYTFFSGSGSLITVWAILFVLVGGWISKVLHIPFSRWTFFARVCSGLLILVFLYYGLIQFKRAYTAFMVRPGDHYTELCSRIADYIPESKVIMGHPLYWFGFVERNGYMAHSFYWERMNRQTNELGDYEQQPVAVSAQHMIAFLKRRKVEYLIADVNFQMSLKPWIPESQWDRFFTVKAKLQSSIYGVPSPGGAPPYEIQVWQLNGDETP